MINVTKPYLPSLQEYFSQLSGVWNSGQLTNHGKLVKELERKLKEYLQVKHVCYVSSGTMALQIALKALELEGEVIVTPFSHVSTLNSLLWQNCKPIYCDIQGQNFCINPSLIEQAITTKTSAILATHIYGYPCNVLLIEEIAKKHQLKVVYDGAQAFGVKIFNQSIFNYGDISAASFHATKVFHTVEGGAIFTNDDNLIKKCISFRDFGLVDGEPSYAGINGKNSEFHAAMGLCNLPKMTDFIDRRREISLFYHHELQNLPLQFPIYSKEVLYNYAYFPIIFLSEEKMQRVKDALYANEINAKRYFYPSLNTLPYSNGGYCPISEYVSKRVLCLPLYYDLQMDDAKRVVRIIVDECSE
jgi:dTDP-4-amino-4,6-dideoxygalactose transaminase